MAIISIIKEPKSYMHAREDRNWLKAMQEELDDLENNHTWFLIDLPKGKKPITSKWVYKLKYKSDCTIDRYKARLVAKRFSQIPSINFHDIFLLLLN